MSSTKLRLESMGQLLVGVLTRVYHSFVLSSSPAGIPSPWWEATVVFYELYDPRLGVVV